jgi:hypothetical protein
MQQDKDNAKEKEVCTEMNERKKSLLKYYCYLLSFRSTQQFRQNKIPCVADRPLSTESFVSNEFSAFQCPKEIRDCNSCR